MAIKLGSLVIEMVAQTSAFTKGMDDARRYTFTSVDGIVNSIKRMGDSFSRLKFDNAKQIEQSMKILGNVAAGIVIGMGAAASAVVSAFAVMVEHAIKTGAEFYVMSQRIGISVESLSALAYAAKQENIELDTLAKSLTRFERNALAVAQGTGKQTNSFKQLKVEVTDSHGRMRPLDDLLGDIASKFAAMPNGIEKTGLAIQLFGRGGAALIPLLNKGREGIQELKEEAAALGVVLDTKTAAAAKRLEDDILRLRKELEGAQLQIAAGFFPALEHMADAFFKAGHNAQTFRDIGAGMGTAIQETIGFINAASVAVATFAKWNQVAAMAVLYGPFAKDKIEQTKAFWDAQIRQGNEFHARLFDTRTHTQKILDEMFDMSGKGRSMSILLRELGVTASDTGDTIDKASKETFKFSTAMKELTGISDILLKSALDPVDKAYEEYRQTIERINAIESLMPEKLRNTADGHQLAWKAEIARGLALKELNRELAKLADESAKEIMAALAAAGKTELPKLVPPPVTMPNLSVTPDFGESLRRGTIDMSRLANASDHYRAVLRDIAAAEKIVMDGLRQSGATIEQVSAYQARFNRLRQEATIEAIRGKIAEAELGEELARTQDELMLRIGGALDDMRVLFHEYERYGKHSAQIVHDAFATAFSGIENAMQSNISAMLMGTVSISEGFQRMGVDMLNAVVNALAQMLAQWITTHIIMAAVAKILGLAGSEQKEADEKAKVSRQKIQSDAAVVGADVFRQAIEKIPFPANLAVAPPLAFAMATMAGSFSAMTMAKFAEGGVVPGYGLGDTVPALLTPKEGVLTTDQMAMLQSANGPSSESTTITVGDINVSIDNNKQNTEEEIVGAVRRGMRRGLLPSGL